jgi:hypothetical protein
MDEHFVIIIYTNFVVQIFLEQSFNVPLPLLIYLNLALNILHR